MARQVSFVLVDDLDGSEASGALDFALDGRSYQLDLSDKNAARLRDALAPFVASARRSGSGRRRSNGGVQRSSQSVNRQKTSAIREWACQHGHNVADRGRISSSVVEAYENSGG